MNAAEIHAMSDDQLRVAIAERLGWSRMHAFIHHKDESLLFGNPPDGKTFERVPNWPTDLNAAAELEFNGIGLMFMFGKDDRGWWFEVVKPEPRVTSWFCATEPRARAEAWLMWYKETHK